MDDLTARIKRHLNDRADYLTMHDGEIDAQMTPGDTLIAYHKDFPVYLSDKALNLAHQYNASLIIVTNAREERIDYHRDDNTHTTH